MVARLPSHLLGSQELFRHSYKVRMGGAAPLLQNGATLHLRFLLHTATHCMCKPWFGPLFAFQNLGKWAWSPMPSEVSRKQRSGCTFAHEWYKNPRWWTTVILLPTSPNIFINKITPVTTWWQSRSLSLAPPSWSTPGFSIAFPEALGSLALQGLWDAWVTG